MASASNSKSAEDFTDSSKMNGEGVEKYEACASSGQLLRLTEVNSSMKQSSNQQENLTSSQKCDSNVSNIHQAKKVHPSCSGVSSDGNVASPTVGISKSKPAGNFKFKKPWPVTEKLEFKLSAFYKLSPQQMLQKIRDYRERYLNNARYLRHQNTILRARIVQLQAKSRGNLADRNPEAVSKDLAAEHLKSENKENEDPVKVTENPQNSEACA